MIPDVAMQTIARLRAERDEKDALIADLRETIKSMAPPARLDGLRPAEDRLVGVLLANEGRAITREHIMAALYGVRERDWPGDKVLDVHVHNARKRLAQHGHPYDIETVRHVGYRIRRTG